MPLQPNEWITRSPCLHRNRMQLNNPKGATYGRTTKCTSSPHSTSRAPPTQPSLFPPATVAPPHPASSHTTPSATTSIPAPLSPPTTHHPSPFTLHPTCLAPPPGPLWGPPMGDVQPLPAAASGRAAAARALVRGQAGGEAGSPAGGRGRGGGRSSGAAAGAAAAEGAGAPGGARNAGLNDRTALCLLCCCWADSRCCSGRLGDALGAGWHGGPSWRAADQEAAGGEGGDLVQQLQAQQQQLRGRGCQAELIMLAWRERCRLAGGRQFFPRGDGGGGAGVGGRQAALVMLAWVVARRLHRCSSRLFLLSIVSISALPFGLFYSAHGNREHDMGSESCRPPPLRMCSHHSTNSCMCVCLPACLPRPSQTWLC